MVLKCRDPWPLVMWDFQYAELCPHLWGGGWLVRCVLMPQFVPGESLCTGQEPRMLSVSSSHCWIENMFRSNSWQMLYLFQFKSCGGGGRGLLDSGIALGRDLCSGLGVWRMGEEAHSGFWGEKGRGCLGGKKVRGRGNGDGDWPAFCLMQFCPRLLLLRMISLIHQFIGAHLKTYDLI